MKKIILAAMSTAAMFAMSDVASARTNYTKRSQYSAINNVDNDELFSNDILGGADWNVSPQPKFKTKRQARNYQDKQEENWGFGHATGSLVAYGQELQSRGFRVSEHPSFGGVHHVHARHSSHYSGNAIDINVGRGVYEARSRHAHTMDQIAAEARAEGYTVLWRVPGHYNHMHIQN